MLIRIDGFDITDYLIDLSLDRTNDWLSGSSISGELSLVKQPVNPVNRCSIVEIVFNDLFPDGVFQAEKSKIHFVAENVVEDIEGKLTISLAQLDTIGFSKAPVYGAAQRNTTANTTKRTGEILAGMLSDFNIPHQIPPFGLPQFDLVGSNDGDPISTCRSLAADNGLLLVTTRTNSAVVVRSPSAFLNAPALAFTSDVLEYTGFKLPELDELFITALKKTKSGKAKKIKETENIYGENRELQSTINTIIEANGDESKETFTVKKLLRPDTYPNSGVMVFAERTKSQTITDNEDRIVETREYIDRNTAIISPESTDDSILVPAESVVTVYDFDDKTNEIKSITTTTKQVFVVGRREAVTYSLGKLTKLKIPTQFKSPTGDEDKLSDEDKKSTIITPLVVAKVETTKYRKLNKTTWLETVTIRERKLESETEGGTDTDPKNTTVRIDRLGGLRLTTNKSKKVYSVPSVQTKTDDQTDIEETQLKASIKSPHSGLCSALITRKERIEAGSSIDEIAFGQFVGLNKLAKLSKTISLSLRPNNHRTVMLLLSPFAKLSYDGHQLTPINIKLSFTTGGSMDIAGDFSVIGVSQIDDDFDGLRPPIVIGESAFDLPVLNDNLVAIEAPVSDPLTPDEPKTMLSAIAQPLVPTVVGVPSAISSLIYPDSVISQQPGKLKVATIDTETLSNGGVSEPVKQVVSSPTYNNEEVTTSLPPVVTSVESNELDDSYTIDSVSSVGLFDFATEQIETIESSSVASFFDWLVVNPDLTELSTALLFPTIV